MSDHVTSTNVRDDRDPRDDLENALVAILGCAEVLQRLGNHDNAIGYLAGILRDHHDDALDAFSRIYKLGEYREAAQ